MLILAADAPRYTILAANDAYCKASRHIREILIGHGIFDVFTDNPDDPDADGHQNLSRSLSQAISEMRPQRLHAQKFSVRQPGVEGFTPHYWEVMNVPVIEEGQLRYIIHSVEDITERVVLERQAFELRERGREAAQRLDRMSEEIAAVDESKTLLQAVIDTAQAGIFMFTPIFDESGTLVDFRFRIANRMLSAYVGQSPEAVTGALGSTWFPAYKSNGLFNLYSDTAVSGRTNRFEFHYDSDGIDVWLDIMSTKVGEDVLVTFTDHTSLKNLQRRLEDHVEELRNSNANLEQFAYIASHDLQEPLRKIKSFGDMLQNRYQEMLGSEGGDLIGRMQSAASRMSILIEDLLTYSRVSVKPGVLKVVQADEVLEGVLFDLERLIQQQSAVIEVEKLAPVAGQSTQLGQLFQNLVSNALKFRHPDRPPEILVRSKMVAGHESGISVAPEDAQKRYQLIRIQDNGIGFDMAYRDRIFQIFQRLHNRNEYPGTGVGLSIVKKVVENHNGYIQVDSVPGEGTTFSILLPAVMTH